MFVQLKNSIWYSTRLNGMQFKGKSGFSVPGWLDPRQYANLYNKLDFLCSCRTFIEVSDRVTKSEGLVSIPLKTAAFKNKLLVSSKRSI